ncbi:MAG: hypothetical protein H0Z24_03120 [Thermosipho sp. (in: Bacteria)]|nr:hypothetical protein [Thermosipho sp. (in: thermotogales)]
MSKDIIIKYHCPVCNKAYDTEEEALNCYKPPIKRFKPGDVVRDKYTGSVYYISYVDKSGASVEIPDELIKARGWQHETNQRVFLIGSFWCRAEKYPVSEAEKLVKELTAKLRYAEKFLELCMGDKSER